MTDRAVINEVCQIGIEGTAGTAAAANRKLLSTAIALRPEGNIEGFAPSGYKFDTIQVIGKEFAVGEIEGKASYNDLAYLFASLIAYAGTPTLSSGTAPTGTAYTWTFAPDSDAADTIKTLTIEEGSSVRAHRAAYGMVNGLEISFDREKVEVSGDVLAARLEDGITLTATPTEVALKPILPNQVDIYLDTTSGGLGSTKLTRAFKASFKYGERQSAIWPLNSSLASFGAVVEKKPVAEITLSLEADSTGMAELDSMRASTTKFLRIEALGGTIHGGTTKRYTFTLDAAVEISQLPSFGEEDEVKTVEWVCKPVHDATWGKAFTISLINTQTF